MTTVQSGSEAPRTEQMKAKFSEVISQLAAAGALIVLFIYLTFASDNFLTSHNLLNVGTQTAVTAIVAMGMTMVIITAGIDLSVGAVAALAGVVATLLMVDSHVAIPIAIVAGMAVGAVCGLISGFMITVALITPFIATLGTMSVARGMANITTDAVAVSGVPPEFRWLGQGELLTIPVPILITVAVAIVIHLTLTRTRFGRHAYAIGSNEEAAKLSGVPVRAVLIGVYVVCGALAGLGGLIAASRVNSGQPSYGVGLELDVIAAAVIGGASLFGGRGTVVGTLIGAFLIALIRNGSVLLDINVFYQTIIIGAVIWAAVAWDGLRRRRLSGEV